MEQMNKENLKKKYRIKIEINPNSNESGKAYEDSYF